ncbi:MAG: tetratricopeptide repeat protein [Planctomycetota bacterium]
MKRGWPASLGLAVLLGGVLFVALRGGEDPAKAVAEAEQLAEEGKRRLASGDAEGALASFEEALTVTPGVPALLYNAGRAAAAAGRTTEAEQRYREAIDALAPQEDWRYHLGLGNLLLKTERAAAAVQPLSRAVSLHDAIATHRSYQDALRASGQVKTAEKLYADRMAGRPEDVDALYLYARLVEAPAGRAGVLKTALERDPDHVWAHLALGNTYLELEDGGSAVKEFEAVRTLDPPNAKALFGLVRAHCLRKDRAAAEAAAKDLQQRHPGSSASKAAVALLGSQDW